METINLFKNSENENDRRIGIALEKLNAEIKDENTPIERQNDIKVEER